PVYVGSGSKAPIASPTRPSANIRSSPKEDADARVAPASSSLRRRLRSISHHRQTDCKRRSTANLALHRNVAAHHLAKPFADREPEACSTVFPRRRCIRLRKFLEQLAHLLRRHANAGIGDSDRNPIAAVFLSMPRVNGNGAALRKFVGVAHEIEQRLP